MLYWYEGRHTHTHTHTHTHHRRIVVHDVEETVFRTFLFFLYGGPLDLPSTQTEDLIELMAVADRYEAAELRGRCEETLVQRVANANVLMLLAVADRYSARRLRVRRRQSVVLLFPLLPP